MLPSGATILQIHGVSAQTGCIPQTDQKNSEEVFMALKPIFLKQDWKCEKDLNAPLFSFIFTGEKNTL